MRQSVWLGIGNLALGVTLITLGAFCVSRTQWVATVVGSGWVLIGCVYCASALMWRRALRRDRRDRNS